MLLPITIRNRLFSSGRPSSNSVLADVSMSKSIISRSAIPKVENEVTVLETARALGMTGFGEMFNASEMAQLAETYYSLHLRSQYWSEPWDDSFIRAMLEKLCVGSIALVPYDVDKNHEPCLSGGRKAHWAAVKGFVVPLFTPEQISYCTFLCGSVLSYVGGLPMFQIDSAALEEGASAASVEIVLTKIVDFSNPQLEHQLRLITQQSKSKHQAIWTYTSLRDSNHNLMHFDEDRGTDPGFKVPSELGALRGKAVFISPHTEDDTRTSKNPM